jgi:hypothetical protein
MINQSKPQFTTNRLAVCLKACEEVFKTCDCLSKAVLLIACSHSFFSIKHSSCSFLSMATKIGLRVLSFTIG